MPANHPRNITSLERTPARLITVSGFRAQHDVHAARHIGGEPQILVLAVAYVQLVGVCEQPAGDGEEVVHGSLSGDGSGFRADGSRSFAHQNAGSWFPGAARTAPANVLPAPAHRAVIAFQWSASPCVTVTPIRNRGAFLSVLTDVVNSRQPDSWRPMDYRQIFATNLRKARHAKGLSQEALAWDARMDRTHLSEIEGAKTWVGLEIIVKLAQVLEVRPADLLQEPPRRSRRGG